MLGIDYSALCPSIVTYILDTRYTAEAGLEDAGTAWCWAVCDPTSEVWSCCGAGCSVQLSLALTTGRHTVYSEHTLLLDTSIYTFIVGYPPLDILSSI